VNLEALSLFLSLLLAVQSQQTVLKFDFQPKEAQVMAGFVEVNPSTIYSKDKGFGFVGKPETGWCPDFQFPDPLVGDCMTVKTPFRIDVPDGNYLVLVYVHNFAAQLPTKTYSILLNGTEAFKEEINNRNFYSKYYYVHQFTDAKPHEDLFEKYVRPRTAPKRIRTSATGGGITIAVKNIMLHGVVIIPLDGGTDADAEHEAVESARKDFFRTHFLKERIPVENIPPMNYSEEDRRRGYVIFARHYLEKVFPLSNPRRREVRKTLNAFAALGEFEPVTFTVHPLKNLKRLRVTVSDLTSAGGDVIPSRNIDVRYVKYTERRHYPRLRGLKFYTVEPCILVKRNSFDAEKGINRTFWLTVKVPENATPSRYTGDIHIEFDNAPPYTLRLFLDVLPLRLERPPDRHHFTGAYPPKQYLIFPDQQEDRKEYYRQLEAQLRDIRDHGFEEYGYYSTWLPAPEMRVENRKIVSLDFTDTKEVCEIYRRVGMPLPPIVIPFRQLVLKLMPEACRYVKCGHSYMLTYDDSPAGKETIISAIAQIRDEAKKQGLPPLEISLPDEPNGDQLKPVVEMARLIKAVDGVGITSSGLGVQSAFTLAPYLTAMGAYIRDPAPYLKAARPHDVMVMVGHGSPWRDPAQMRFRNGFWFYKSGVDAIRWWYYTEMGDPYLTIDSAGGWESNLIYPTPEGTPNPTIDYECCREGVDDVRYIYTLEKRVAEARRSPSRAVRVTAERARAVLEGIMSRVFSDYHLYKGKLAVWSPEASDAYRRRIADAIVEIQETAAGKSVVKKPREAERAPWWSDAFSKRLQITVASDEYSRENCLVRAELPPMKNFAASRARLVEPIRDGKEQVQVPFCLMDGKLVWRLSGWTPAATVRHFYLYFAPTGRSMPPLPPDEQMRKEAEEFWSKGNLLPNSSFEKAEGDTPDAPAHWSSWKKQVQRTDELAHTGGYSLKLIWGKRRPGSSSEPIEVKGNTEYLLSCWTLVAKGTGRLPMWCTAHCFDENDNFLDKFYTTRKYWEKGWVYRSIRFTTPPETRYVKVSIAIGQLDGVVYFDDVELCEYNRDRTLPPRVTVGKVERAEAE